MAQVTRLNIAQQGGGSKTVAFTDDIKLNALTQGNLILVNTTDKTATVAVDSSKLSINATAGNVKVNTPLELKVETVIPADDGKLHAVDTGTGVKLYWGSNVIEAHDPQEGYVTTQDFNKHAQNETTAKHLTADQLALVAAVPTTGTIATEAKVEEIVNSSLAPVEAAIDGLTAVTSGYTGPGAIKGAVDAAQDAADDAQAAADAAQATADAAQATATDAADAAAAADTKAQGAVDAIGAWTTISDKTVKAAIEENKAEIANGLNAITAGTSGTGVTVTVGTKTNKSQTVAVSVQDATTSQKGIVQLASAHSGSDTSKAATGATVASAISTYDTNTIGSWTTGGKYTGTVKAAIESIAAISMFKVVSTLPATGETNTIYIVKPASKPTGPYEEYIWVDNAWEKIGDTDIQLENYYKKSEIGGTYDESNTLTAYVNTQDNAIKNTVDTDEASSTDGHVTVALTGTVADHGLTVTTNDIASASSLSALTTRVSTAEGEIDAVEGKLAGITGTVKAYVDAADGELDTRLDTVEGKLTGLPEGKTIEQAIEAAVDVEETRATAAEGALGGRLTTAESAISTNTANIGTLTNLTTEAKGNLVAAVNEVDAHADAATTAAAAAQTTANNALAKANTALQGASGDANINASVSGTTVSVGVKANSDLAKLLAACTLTTSEEA